MMTGNKSVMHVCASQHSINILKWRSAHDIEFSFFITLMARKRKNRTHLKGVAPTAATTADGLPKSFVIKHGQVGSSLTQLVRNMRKVMEPNTATRLKVPAFDFLRSYKRKKLMKRTGTKSE
jgi:hypothetical protein